MDKLTPQARSENMRKIRSKDTKPELFVRKIVYGLGYRYRLHWKKLPGCPDLVFPGRKKVIFVHGCFWHQHEGNCKISRIPKSNKEFWIPKLMRTKERDRKNYFLLSELGWRYLIIWECEIGNVDNITKKLKNFLDN